MGTNLIINRHKKQQVKLYGKRSLNSLKTFDSILINAMKM